MKIQMLVFSILFILSLSFALANELMTVESDIIVPVGIVSIEVPEFVDLGNLTVGYDIETERVKVYVNNTGTVDVKITPQLTNSNEIYENIFFTKRLSGEEYNWTKIGEWDLFIEKPSQFGEKNDEYFYMKLNLEDFTGEITESLLDYQEDILFVAVEQ